MAFPTGHLSFRDAGRTFQQVNDPVFPFAFASSKYFCFSLSPLLPLLFNKKIDLDGQKCGYTKIQVRGGANWRRWWVDVPAPGRRGGAARKTAQRQVTRQIHRTFGFSPLFCLNWGKQQRQEYLDSTAVGTDDDEKPAARLRSIGRLSMSSRNAKSMTCPLATWNDCATNPPS